MRKINIDNITPGMKLSRTIFTPEGRILLTSGMDLKDIFIDKLRENSITELYVEDEISNGIDVADIINEETRHEAKDVVKKLIQGYNFSDSLNYERIRDAVNKIIDDLLSNKDILINLADIKSVDDYTFEHSVNVCVLSLIIGIGLGYNLTRLKDLGIGAILHDIGKMRVPEDILKKPSQLSVEEFEQIKKHTVYGYEILKKCPSVTDVACFIAIGHHERFDGSGYPLRLKGENIHQCARIVAVADVYDALTSDRVYRKKLKPHEAISYMLSTGSAHFDTEILDTLVKHISIYPIGTGVVLNNGQKGIVVRSNPENPIKPLIRILYDKYNCKLKQFHDLDLEKYIGLHIIDSYEI